MDKFLRSAAFAPVFLAGVVVVLFLPVFLAGPGGTWGAGTVVSAPYGDVFSQFFAWREYGFARLASGDVPLWNPNTFGGQPFLGNWQTALFYPPNWLHLVLPTAVAINVLVAVHVYLAGLWCSVWLRDRGYGPAACAAGGLVFMLSAPVIGRVFPGHLTWIAVVAWAPLVFLAVDRLLDTGRMSAAWLGGLAVGLMILAGYPQPVYITLLGAGVYLVLNLLASRYRVKAVAGFVAMVLAGTALAAIQAFPGVETGLSSSRAGGTSFEYATSYAVPVQNLLLLVAPLALGGPSTNTYGGKGFLWEAWPYVGALFLFAGALGALSDPSPRRRWSVTLIVLFTVLALGSATPLYRLVYEALPGLSSFRAPGRFLLMVALLSAPLVASGVECLGAGAVQRWHRLVILTLLATSAAMLLALAVISGDSAAGPIRTPALLASAAVLLVACGAFALCGRWKWALPALAVLAVGELGVVASRSLATGPVTSQAMAVHAAALASVEPGTRAQVQDISLANLPLRTGHLGLTGYDPLQQKRVTEFFAASQGEDPREVDEIVGLLRPHPSWRLLRASALIHPGGQVTPLPGALPRAMLVTRAEVVPTLAVRLSRLMAPDFDPTSVVLLESPPSWNVGDGDLVPGREELSEPLVARVTEDTGDRLSVEVSLKRLAVLVITDSYAPGWRAVRTDTGEPIDVVPANHVLRGLALQPGTYTVEMSYLPTGFLIGRWVSVAAALGFAAWGISLWRASRRSSAARPHTDPTTMSSG